MPKYRLVASVFHNYYLFLAICNKNSRIKTALRQTNKMSNLYFQFKRFTVWHDQCAMKVGTDGVLLGAWTPVESARRMLDIGTGTGLVALMLAQRSLPDANIVALEIDEAAVGQAKENVTRSPWKERVEVVQADFKKYQSSDKFDVIVSNPPYFVDSLECPDRQRAAARHNDALTYDDLLEGVSGLLTDDGFFTIVIPSDVADRVKAIAFAKKLYAVRQLNVITKPGGVPKRTLITFSFSIQECVVEELLTELSRHQYSEEYIALTREYYLNM